MQLTRQADYALRTMLEVAARPYGEITTTLELSRRRLMPLPFVRKIVSRLTAAGLLRTRRGGNGGTMLSRPAPRISLLEIIDAADRDTITVNRCVLRPESCPLQPICPLHEVCRSARAEMVRLFGSVSLSDMVARGAELERLRSTRAVRRPASAGDRP